MAVTASELTNPVLGKQPSFIQGSYPNATWNTFDALPGFSLYEPYGQDVINSNLASAGPFIKLNQCVIDQYASYYAQLNPGAYKATGANSPNCPFPVPIYGTPSVGGTPTSNSKPAVSQPATPLPVPTGAIPKVNTGSVSVQHGGSIPAPPPPITNPIGNSSVPPNPGTPATQVASFNPTTLMLLAAALVGGYLIFS